MDAETLAARASFKSDARVISLVGFAHGTSHFFHLLLPPLFPWFMREWNLGYAEVGTLMTTFFVVSGIGQAMAGIWVDRFGAHRVICAGILTMIVAALCAAVAPSFGALLCAAALVGAGNSVFHPADFALLARRVSQPRMGHAFSTHGVSGNLGWAIAPLLMVSVATPFGWRWACVAAALFGAIALGLLWSQRALLQYELHQAAQKAEGTINALPNNTQANAALSIGDILRIPMIWFAFAFFLFATLGFGALQNFAPSLFRELFNLSIQEATSAFSIYLIGSSAGLILGGFLAKPGNRHELYVLGAFASGAVVALVIGFLPIPTVLVLPLMALMGFGVGIAGPSRDLLVRAATKAQLGEAAYGRVYGIVYSGLDVGLAVAPLIFGLLLDHHLPRIVFAGISASLLAAVVAAVLLARSEKQKR